MANVNWANRLRKVSMLIFALSVTPLLFIASKAEVLDDNEPVVNLVDLNSSRITPPKEVFTGDTKGITFALNKNPSGSKLSIAGVTFDKGFFTHANNGTKEFTEINTDISGLGYKYFSVYVGIDGAMPLNGSCEFYILCDGKITAKSRIIYSRYQTEPYQMVVNVDQVNTLTLRITNGGDDYTCDWGVWGEPKLYMNKEDINIAPQVSFTYPSNNIAIQNKSISIRGTATSTDEITLSVNENSYTVPVSSDNIWEYTLPDIAEGMVNISAKIVGNNNKILTSSSVTVFSYNTLLEVGELHTSDSKVKLGVINSQPAIISLTNIKSGKEWLDSPSVIPIIDNVSLGYSKRMVNWQYVDTEVNSKVVDGINETLLKMKFVDEENGLELYSIWWAGDTGAIKHHIEIKNNSSKKITLPYQRSMEITASAGSNEPFYMFSVFEGGGTPSAIGELSEQIDAAYLSVITAQKIPIAFLNLNNKEGLYIAHEWGSGLITVNGFRDEFVSASVSVGLNRDFKTDLDAGETFIVPTSFFGTYNGDVDNGSNTLKKWLYQYNVPNIIKTDDKWPHIIWNTIGVIGWTPEAKKFYPLIDSLKNTGVNRIVIDTDWWTTGIDGDWVAARERWPLGMADAGKYVKNSGMDFVLYFTFHNGQSKKEDALTSKGKNGHPEWFTNNGTKEDYADLGNKDAVQFIKTSLLKRLQEYNAISYRSDFNPVPGTSVQKNRHKYGVDTEYWNYVGFNEIIDYLYDNYEGFSYENCNCGGTMMDFATMKRTSNVFATDTYLPIDARKVFYDCSYIYPAAQLSPNLYFIWNVKDKLKEYSNEYIYRSIMQGVMYFTSYEMPKDMAPEEWSVIQRCFNVYTEWMKPLVNDANLYHVFPRPDGINWDGIQYFDTNTQKGALMVFKPDCEAVTQTVMFKGLDSTKEYYIRSEETKDLQKVSGATLMEKGFSITLNQIYSSDILYIQACEVLIDNTNIAWEGVNVDNTSKKSIVDKILIAVAGSVILAGSVFLVTKAKKR